jgi:hypothetical protein
VRPIVPSLERPRWTKVKPPKKLIPAILRVWALDQSPDRVTQQQNCGSGFEKYLALPREEWLVPLLSMGFPFLPLQRVPGLPRAGDICQGDHRWTHRPGQLPKWTAESPDSQTRVNRPSFDGILLRRSTSFPNASSFCLRSLLHLPLYSTMRCVCCQSNELVEKF